MMWTRSQLLSFCKHGLRMVWKRVAKSFSAVFIPPRGTPRLAKWIAIRSSVSLLVLLFVSPYIIAIVGNIYIPPRRLQPPRTPYGLSLVDTLPPSQVPAVDVVFVHGLGSFPDTTWMKRKMDKARTSMLYDQVSWVRDLLPVDLPAARLLYFNYDSTTYNDAPYKMLEDIADELLLAFTHQSIRTSEDEISRPIVFLCHSYGGLVVKEALVRAQQDHEKYSDILNNSYGVLFLGTPHRGTQYAGYARAVALRLNRLSSNPDIFLPLEVNSTQLQAQHGAFLRYYEGQLKIANFYETHRQVIFRPWMHYLPHSIMIVEKFSATFEAANTTNSLLDTDHSGLNKFDAKDDYNYTRIIFALRNMIRKVLSDRQTRRIAKEAIQAAQRKADMLQSYIASCPSTRNYIVHPQTVASYTERHILMNQLTALMEDTDNRRSPPRSVALWGPGGAGKSQLALRYAEENRKRYDPIIWIDASTPAAAIKSYTEAFTKLDLDYPINLMDQRYKEATLGGRYLPVFQEDWVIPTVMQWLESRYEAHCEWLVLIDNADDIYGVQDLIPRGVRGSVIITSRDRLIRDHVSHDLEVDQLTTDEGLDLLLYGVAPVQSLTNLNGEERKYMLLQQEALPIVEAFGHSALLLYLANRYILQHPQVYENISKYLDYHEEMSFTVLNNTRLGLQDHYRFTLATVYETSLAAVHAVNPKSAFILSLFAFLNGGIAEDQLFREAGTTLAFELKYHSTWRPFLVSLQVLLCSLAPRLGILFLLAIWPWTPNLTGRTKVHARQLLTIFPLLSDATYLFVVYVVERWRIDSGDVITPNHLLAPYTIITLIYVSLSYTLPNVSQWVLQDKKLPWNMTVLPAVYAASVFMGWAWAVFYYGLDVSLEHHTKALLDRIEFSRLNMTQFEKALLGLQRLSREQLGMVFPMKLSWMIFWRMLWDIVLWIVGTVIATLWFWICDVIVSRLRKVRNPRLYVTCFMWFIRLISTPAGATMCFMAGYGIGQTGIMNWRPWKTYYIPEGFVSPHLLNSLLNTTSDGLWESRAYDEALAPLAQYGLLHRSPELGYTMHPLIQWWARQRLEPAMRAAWVAEASRFMGLVYQSSACFREVLCQQVLIPHLVEVAGADVTNDGTAYWRLKHLLKMLYRSLRMVGRI